MFQPFRNSLIAEATELMTSQLPRIIRESEPVLVH